MLKSLPLEIRLRNINLTVSYLRSFVFDFSTRKPVLCNAHKKIEQFALTKGYKPIFELAASMNTLLFVFSQSPTSPQIRKQMDDFKINIWARIAQLEIEKMELRKEFKRVRNKANVNTQKGGVEFTLNQPPSLSEFHQELHTLFDELETIANQLNSQFDVTKDRMFLFENNL